MSIWEVKTTYQGSRSIIRQVNAKSLKVGSFPDNDVRLPNRFPKHLICIEIGDDGGLKASQQDVKAKVKKTPQGFDCSFEGLEIEIKELTQSRKTPSERLHSWIGSQAIKSEDKNVVLWHILTGQIVESMVVSRKAAKLKLPVSGFAFDFDWSMRKLILQLPSGDLRTVELKEEQRVLSGEWGKHKFIVSSEADASLAESLIPKRQFLNTIKKDNFAPLLMLIVGVWVCLIAFLQFGPVMNDMEETIEEKLSPEYAKVRIEKRQKKEASSGGGRGGGGVQSAKNNDARGGAGYYDEVLVQDRNVLASAVGVLDAFSSLDQKMAAAVNTVGAGVANGKNRARGILAALGNMAGSGGGGTGVGGLGTKGFGGGGGGGTGNGYGTGIGAGVGKGEAGRGVSFEDANVSIRGALEKSEINAVVDENFAQIRFCYNRALRGNPSLKGKVISNFVIGSDGAVTVSRIASTTLLNPSVENCIRKRITTWQFPQPRGGGSVTVNYPFLFNRT